MIEIVLASSNPGKIKELKALLEEVNIRLISLEETGFSGEIPETGQTLKENAIQKAVFVHEKFNKNALADDTGLEVEALDNRPGVYSARYAGPQKNNEDNIKKLLSELEGKTNRNARFVTWMALTIDQVTYTFKGEVKGTILEKPRGENGFGYDPIFLPEGETLTFAEMDSEQKNRISHRGKALEHVRTFFSEMSQE